MNPESLEAIESVLVERDHLRTEVERLKVELARLRLSRRRSRAKARRPIRWMR